MKRLLALVLASGCVLSGLSPAQGDSRQSVVIFVEGEQSVALTRRICSELEAMGIAAQPVALSTQGYSEKSTESIAAEHDAAAAVGVKLSEGVIDVWVADRVTGKNVHRTTEIHASSQPLETVVVVMAVELLRASLMELHGKQQPVGQVEPSADLVEFSLPPKKISPVESLYSKRLFVDLGASMTYPSFDLSPSAGLFSAVFVRVLWRLQLGMMGILPLSTNSAEFQEGDVKVSAGFIGGGLGLLIGKENSRIGAHLRAGAGAALFSMRGNATPEYLSYSQFQSVAMPFASGAFKVALSKQLVVLVDVLLGWTTAKTTVLVVDREVALLGRPWFSGSIAFEVAIF